MIKLFSFEALARVLYNIQVYIIEKKNIFVQVVQLEKLLAIIQSCLNYETLNWSELTRKIYKNLINYQLKSEFLSFINDTQTA